MKVPWIIKDTAGAILLLGVVICIPVWVTDYTAPKTMPFRPKPPNRQAFDIPQSDPETSQAIVSTLANQIQAIRKGDFKEAYKYASRGTRENISLGEFERLVSVDLYPILDYEAAEIGDVRDNGSQAMIGVRLSKEGVTTAIYRFVMALENQEWRVIAVFSEALPPKHPVPPENSTPDTTTASIP